MWKKNVSEKNKKEKIQKKHTLNKKTINKSDFEEDTDILLQEISSFDDEDIKIPKKNKFYGECKSLPCENFIRDGCCVYKHKCKYIHDYRLEDNTLNCTPKKGINKKFKNKDESMKCSFFYDQVQAKIEKIEDKENEIYEPNIESNYIFDRRLPIFKHLEKGNSIYNYDEKKYDTYMIQSDIKKTINFDYQNGFFIYKNLINYLESIKKKI